MSYKEYEQLITKIVEGIAQLQGLQNSQVKHDALVVGISGASHQIDVLWEFDVGPMKYKTLFQAKDWKNKVSLVAVNTFSGVLRDIPEAKGVMVTRTGYDTGNIERIAIGYGIKLLILEPANGLMPEGVPMLSAQVTLTNMNIGITNFKFVTEQEADAFRKYSDEVDRGKIIFATESGKQSTISQLTDHIRKLAADQGLDRNGQDLTFLPEETLLVHTPAGITARITAIRASISSKEEVLGRKSMFINHVLRCATGDDTYYVDDQFRVHKQERVSMDLVYRDPRDPAKTLTTTFSVEDRTKRKKS